jgi:hypothetical protein
MGILDSRRRSDGREDVRQSKEAGERILEEIDYLGLALIGNKKTINKVTGRLGLWR